jgi:hypothetical protein
MTIPKSFEEKKTLDQQPVDKLLAGSGYIGVTTVEFAASALKFASMQVADCEAGKKMWSPHFSTFFVAESEDNATEPPNPLLNLG